MPARTDPGTSISPTSTLVAEPSITITLYPAVEFTVR